MLTNEQAMLICDSHEIIQLLDNEEEVELLSDNNPELLEAYVELVKMAKGA
jgi:hypothetical protein